MKFPHVRTALAIWLCLCSYSFLWAQSTVSIDFQTQRFIGNSSTFDRAKYINIHSDFSGNDFDEIAELSYLVDSLGVGFGRNVGNTRWIMSQLQNDPANPDFPDVSVLNSNGAKSISDFQNRTAIHPYNTDQMVYTSHITPIFPNSVTAANPPTGYVPLTYAGSASFLRQFFEQYFAQDSASPGKQRPTYYEVMNEPFVHKGEYNTTIAAMSQFHNVIADTLHRAIPGLKVGGYTAAWPEYERNDFDIWRTTMKEFMDIAGANMDFISVHFYDVPADTTQVGSIRAGSNVEACLDMIETYSTQQFGEIKPIMISEYGACCGGLGWEGPHTDYRDWRILKSANALLMTFLKRQNRLEKSIPFIVGKAKWWLSNNSDPYPYVLYHRNGSKWRFTNLVKWYEFWRGVEGERVGLNSTDPDIQLEAFARDQKAYVFINNYEFDDHPIRLQLTGKDPTDIAELKIRRLYLDESTQAPVLEEEVLDPAQEQLTLKGEESVLLEYSFNAPVRFEDSVYEDRFYAQENLLPIQPNQPLSFTFRDLPLVDKGEAILRISVGRSHGKSLTPQLKVNGNAVEVPTDWFGYDQQTRNDFYGMIEVPVPLDYLSGNTNISLTFPDAGGRVASAVFSISSSELTVTSQRPKIAPQDWNVYPNPTEQKVFLDLPSSVSGTIQITLLDIHGRQVLQRSLRALGQTENVELDISHVTPGMYQLHVLAEDWQGAKKLCIN